MNKAELLDCLKKLSKTNNLRDGIDIKKEEANIIVNEIERLNNIINELEEEISKHIALCTDITLNDILDILQELKGSDKSE